MKTQNNLSRPLGHLNKKALLFGALLLNLVWVGLATAQQAKYNISGNTRVITTTNAITGDATGSALKAALTGNEFQIKVSGLPSEKPVQLEFGFAELEKTGSGQRLFNLEVNGKRALSAFDIVQESGGPLRSVVKRFTITPADGHLNIRFSGLSGDALVNYIQITGDGVKTLISAPGPASTGSIGVPDDDDYIPADDQANFNAETGIIDLDGTAETWNSGVPIGGIGAGKFELLPNGQFGNLTISNSWDLPVLRPRGTFLAIGAKATSGRGGARLLQVNPSDHKGERIYPDYSGMGQGKFEAKFPVGKLELEDEKFPLKVTLEGWSPIIPHNITDSSLPAGVIYATVNNPQKYPLSVGVVFSWEDISGRGGSLLPGDQHGFSAASTHKDAATSEVTGFQIASTHMANDRAATFTGDYFVGTPIKGAVITRTLAWNPRTNSIPWWSNFTRRLRLERIPSTPAATTGKNGTGPMASAICVSFNLAPKEVRRIPFIVSWYTPRIVTLDARDGDPTQEAPDYAERFGSSIGVASYLAANRLKLWDQTEEWLDMIDRATVPQWMKTHALNSLFPFRSNTVLLKNQRFAMLESPADMKGMLGPVDLKLGSSDFILTMFPELEKSELNLYARAQDASGRIPRYVGNIHGALAGFDPELLGNDWTDPTASWLLEVARYWRETGDDTTLTALKPAVSKAREFLLAQLNGPGADINTNVLTKLTGVSDSGIMTRLKIAGALQVSEDLLDESSEQIAAIVEAELARINQAATTSTFAPAMAGVYGVQTAAGRQLVNPEQVGQYLNRIHQGNYAPSKPVPAMQSPAVPNQRLSAPAPLQSYVGALSLQNGNLVAGVDAYLRMFQVAYGAQKGPWKQALLYDAPAASKPILRYHRSAMSAWSMWRGLSGVVYDMPNQRLIINPVSITTASADMEMPVFTPAFWGWMKYNAADSTGTLAITKVLAETTPTLSSVGTSIDAEGKAVKGVEFPEPLLLEEGATLRFDGWPGTAGGTVVAEKPAPPPPPPLDLDMDFETTGTLVINDDGTTSIVPRTNDEDTTDTDHIPLSSPETAEGEEMTLESQE